MTKHTQSAGDFLPVFESAVFRQIPVVRLGMMIGGDKRDRTADLLRARQALSQLSYIPNSFH